MRLVVDTNVLISALIKDSVTRKIIMHIKAKLYSPIFLQEEVEKYKNDILRKANLNEIEFKVLFDQLKNRLVFLDYDFFSSKYDEAEKIMNKIDSKDTPFIAAALATNSEIWSDDKHFEKQKKVKVWKTSELAKLMERNC